MQLRSRNRIESSAQSRAQRKCPTSSDTVTKYIITALHNATHCHTVQYCNTKHCYMALDIVTCYTMLHTVTQYIVYSSTQCYTLLHGAIHCYTVHYYSATWCYTLLHSAIHCYTVHYYSATRCYTSLHSAMHCYTVRYYSATQCYTLLLTQCYTLLHGAIHMYIALSHNVLVLNFVRQWYTLLHNVTWFLLC